MCVKSVMIMKIILQPIILKSTLSNYGTKLLMRVVRMLFYYTVALLFMYVLFFF